MSDLTALENAWCDWMEKRGFRTIGRQDDGVSQTSFIAGGRAEGARIRRELLAEISNLTIRVDWRSVNPGAGRPGDVPSAALLAALDRICPEEKE